MERIYKAGRVVEVSRFWAAEQTKPRAKKKAGSTPRKQDQNDRDAVKRLARWINANFCHGDLWVTLTYSAEGMGRIIAAAGNDMDAVRNQANRQAMLFLRRMQRVFKASEIELKYILVTSDLDGDTGEVVRVHHHIIMPRAAFELCEQKWPFGAVDYQILRDQDDYTPLAVYLLRQVRRQPDAKKYTPSRNLKKPEVRERIATRQGPLRTPAKAKLLAASEYDMTKGSHYIRYVIDRPVGTPVERVKKGRAHHDKPREKRTARKA